jgi:hypothetical protein
MKWITRERPKIDRIACPWLIQKFVDPKAEFLYVPKNEVLKIAKEQDAIPYDIAGVELTHVGPNCSFDAIIKKYNIQDTGIILLANIVRAADTDTLSNAHEAAGLLAITKGLSVNYTNDHEMLKIGMIIYDALYAWCQQQKNI